MKKYLELLMLSTIVLMVTSCMTPTDVVYMQDLTPDSPKEEPEVQYLIIRPKDKLYINVHCRDEAISSLFNIRRTSGMSYSYGGNYGGGGTQDLYTYNVSEDGDINFPVVGMIHVGGLTRQEAADRIRDILIEQNLVKDPYVSCAFASAYYYTMGEAGSHGRNMIPRDAFTIVEAIAQAEDISISGDRTNVRVIREVNGALHTYNVDMTSAESLVHSPVYYIQPNDIIYIVPNKKRQFDTTAMGNSVRTPTFWLSLVGTTLSLGVTIYTIIRRI